MAQSVLTSKAIVYLAFPSQMKHLAKSRYILMSLFTVESIVGSMTSAGSKIALSAKLTQSALKNKQSGSCAWWMKSVMKNGLRAMRTQHALIKFLQHRLKLWILPLSPINQLNLLSHQWSPNLPKMNFTVSKILKTPPRRSPINQLNLLSHQWSPNLPKMNFTVSKILKTPPRR